MASRALVSLLFATAIIMVDCNLEGDVLSAWKSVLVDPRNVLQSWNASDINPCTWLHITCNSNDSVVRVDLGNARLSGPLIPQLGQLANLKYLEVFDNGLNGTIPASLGNLTNLISVGLYGNQLEGEIPSSFGNLNSLMFLRLQDNKLNGTIPVEVYGLIARRNLRILNVANNEFTGTIRRNNSTGYAITTVIQDANAPA